MESVVNTVSLTTALEVDLLSIGLEVGPGWCLELSTHVLWLNEIRYLNTLALQLAHGSLSVKAYFPIDLSWPPESPWTQHRAWHAETSQNVCLPAKRVFQGLCLRAWQTSEIWRLLCHFTLCRVPACPLPKETLFSLVGRLLGKQVM